jgi:hypothetical protein
VEEVELFDVNDDSLSRSRIVMEVYEVNDGYLPHWFMEIRDGATFEEVLALQDGVDLVRDQFSKLIDLMVSYKDDDGTSS